MPPEPRRGAARGRPVPPGNRPIGGLADALALNLWVISGFLLYKTLAFLGPLLVPKAVPTTGQCLFLLATYGPYALVVGWLIIGLWMWWAWAAFHSVVRRVCDWLLCDGADPPTGDDDGSGMFATLAGFAMAQGAAITVVAKGEGRDAIVLSIYGIIVVFSYFWTRRTFLLRAASTKYDIATFQYGQYTLAWIVFLGTLVFTLGCYDLLPNQKARTQYDGRRIECLTYRTTDKRFSGFNGWVGLVTGVAPGSNVNLWIESSTGFDNNYGTFSAHLAPISRFRVAKAVAFLRHQESPSVPPSYRQIEVKIDEKRDEKSNGCTLTIVNPDEGDKVVAVCAVNDGDQHSNVQERDSMELIPTLAMPTAKP